MAMYGDDEILYPIDDENMEVYVPFSSLNKNNYQNDSDDEKFFEKNMFDIDETERNKNLINYYCAICGRVSIIIDAKLERLPVRHTDGS